MRWDHDPAYGPRWRQYFEEMGEDATARPDDQPRPLPHNRATWRAYRIARSYRQHIPAGLGGSIRGRLDWPAVQVRLEIEGLWTPEIRRGLVVCERALLQIEDEVAERERQARATTDDDPPAGGKGRRR